MLAHKGLVILHYVPWFGTVTEWRFSKVSLDAIVDSKVDCPIGDIGQDRGTQTTIQSSNSVLS